jgi:deoxyribonuclease V
MRGQRVLAEATVTGVAAAPYQAGLLALREGPCQEAAVRALPLAPDVLLLDATGRDHPRRAGLALHLGAVTGLPTVGVTHRPLLADGPWPPDEPGAYTPLELDGERVGAWVRTRVGRSRSIPGGAPHSKPPSRWCLERSKVTERQSRFGALVT